MKKSFDFVTDDNKNNNNHNDDNDKDDNDIRSNSSTWIERVTYKITFDKYTMIYI